MTEWVFVTGMPRSGTTLAAWLLNRHPDCCILIETGFGTQILEALQPPVDDDQGYCGVQWRGHTQTTEGSWLLKRLCHPQQGQRDTPPTAEELARSMCEALRAHWPVRCLGDKSPGYCFQWQALRAVFPACRLVVCDRDLDAAARSVARQSWAPAGRDHEGLCQWLRSYRQAVADCPETFRLVLEELEQDPRGRLGELLAYVGLEPDRYDMDAAVAQVRTGRVN